VTQAVNIEILNVTETVMLKSAKIAQERKLLECHNVINHIIYNTREQDRRKRPERWRPQDWLLHHDNAPAHTVLSVQRFLAAKNMAVVPHPPYSPDLTPCNFLLFPRMKSKRKWRRFQDVTEIQEQSLTVLHAIPKSQFQRCFQHWQKR
jgi:hypothetical protein